MSFSNRPNATASLADIVLPPVVVHSQGFETSGAAWSTSFSRSNATGVARNGAYGATYTGGGVGGGGVLWNGATGLVVGRSYTLRVWARRNLGTGTFGLLLVPSGVGSVPITTAWAEYALTFTATATTQSFYFGYATAGTFHIDDATLTLNDPVGTKTLKIDGGDLTMDKGRVPFVSGSVTVPLTDELLVEQLDPYDAQRVVIEADAGTNSRTFDLAMTKRTVNHKDRTIDVELATDEALLMRFSKLTDDKTPRTHEANLRNLVNYVLGVVIPGKTLESGTATADLTARWSMQNAITNPNGINGGAAFVPSGNLNLAWSGGNGVDGNPYPIGTSQAAGQAFLLVPQGVSTKKGDMWTFSAYMHRANAEPAVNGIIRVYEMDTAGNIVRQVESTPTTIVPSGATAPYDWTRISSTFVVTNPATVRLQIYVSIMAGAAGRSFAADRFMLTEGPELTDFFSGTTAPTGYTTTWGGQTPTANNAISTRTPTDGIERKPELFTWKAGVTAWDFLETFVSAAKLRLWCDEARKWRLVDPLLYAVPGRFIAQVSNTAEGTDTIDASDTERAPTGVIARFTWTDANGDPQTKDDTSGVNGRVLIMEFDRPYPGPGTAALILQRFAGQGRVQDVRVGTDYTLTPGMEVGLVLPGTAYQLGTLQSVRWNLTEGVMDIGSANLASTPAGAINLLPGTIDSLAGTINALS